MRVRWGCRGSDQQRRTVVGRRSGASALTYGLVLGLVSIAAITAVQETGEEVRCLFFGVAGEMQEVAGDRGGGDALSGGDLPLDCGGGFAFIDRIGVEPDTAITSNAVTARVSGSVVSVRLQSPDAGTQMVLNGNPAGTSAQLSDGDRLQLVTTSADAFSTQKTVTVATDFGTAPWRVTTRERSLIGGSISFGDLLGLDPGQATQTNSETLTGFELGRQPGDPVPSLSVSGATVNPVLVLDGSPRGSSADVEPNDQLAIAVTAPNAFSASQTVTVDGNILPGPTSFLVTTRDQDIEAEAISFNDLNGLDPGQGMTTNTQTLTGFELGLQPGDVEPTVTVSGGANPVLVIDGTPSGTSASVGPNDQIAITITAPNAFAASETVTVDGNILPAPASFQVTTRSQDSQGTAISFANLSGLDPSQTTQTNTQILTGFELPLQPGDVQPSVSVSGAVNPVLLIDGSASGTTATVEPGDQIAIAVTAPSGFSQSETVTVTGTMLAAPVTFTVSTRARDVTPVLSGSFGSVSNVQPGSSQTSGVITYSDFDLGLPVSLPGAGTLQINRGSGWVNASGSDNVFDGDQVRILLTASASENQSSSAAGGVSGFTDSFSVTTWFHQWQAGSFGSCSANPQCVTTSTGSCSASCGGGSQTVFRSCQNTSGTQTRSVTCQRSDGTNVSTSICSSSAINSQPSSSQGCSQGCSGCSNFSQSCNTGTCAGSTTPSVPGSGGTSPTINYGGGQSFQVVCSSDGGARNAIENFSFSNGNLTVTVQLTTPLNGPDRYGRVRLYFTESGGNILFNRMEGNNPNGIRQMCLDNSSSALCPAGADGVAAGTASPPAGNCFSPMACRIRKTSGPSSGSTWYAISSQHSGNTNASSGTLRCRDNYLVNNCPQWRGTISPDICSLPGYCWQTGAC